jgi:hypothetical protein
VSIPSSQAVTGTYTSCVASLPDHTLIQIADDAVATSLDGEAVILDVASGSYFGLEGVGAFVWDHLQNPITFADLVRVTVQAYDIDHATCAEDLSILLGDLRRAGLVRLDDVNVARGGSTDT